MSFTLGLVSISIPNVHASIRETRNTTAFRTFNGRKPISQPDQDYFNIPIAISVKGPTSFNVAISFDDDISSIVGKPATLIPTLKHTGPLVTFPSPPQQMVPQPSAEQIKNGQMVCSFPMNIQGPTSEVPWGFVDYISFQLQVDGDEVFPIQEECSLVVYALADDLPEYANTEGIPVEFLEMMVLPTISRNITTRESWIEFVVWRCFASRLDQDLEKDNPARWKDAVHSYRYNSFLGGTSNYTHFGGSTFDLDQWLTNCNPPKKDQWFGVNCYDMSAVLQTALRLGLPYNYVDQNGNKVPNVLTVSKAWRDPYGYIQDLDLIGWGNSNSPFFNDAEQKELDLDTTSTRQGFGNHAWVSVRMSGTNQGDLSALDACAGPGATPIPMQEYLDNSVDAAATLQSGKYPLTDPVTNVKTPFSNNLQPLEYTGVVSILSDQPLSLWEKTSFMGDSTLNLTYQTNPVRIDGYGNLSNGLVAVEKLISTNQVKPIPVPVLELLENGFNTLASSLNLPAAPAGTFIPLLRSKTFTYGPFTIRTPELSVTSDGSSFQFDIWKDDFGSPLMSLSVVVLADMKMALEYLVGHFSMMNHAVPSTWDITQDKISTGSIDIFPQTSVPVGAVVRSNVLVTADGTADIGTMTAVLKSMGEFMVGYFGKPLTKIDPATVKLVMFGGLPSTAGESIDLYFNIPNAHDFSLASKTKMIRIAVAPAANSYNDSNWFATINCVKLPGNATHEMTVVGAFAAQHTYYTTSKEFPLAPEGSQSTDSS